MDLGGIKHVRCEADHSTPCADSRNEWSYYPFESSRLIYVPPGLTLQFLHGAHSAFMCSVRISQQTATFALHNISRLVRITKLGSVYCAVRTDSLYKPETLSL